MVSEDTVNDNMNGKYLKYLSTKTILSLNRFGIVVNNCGTTDYDVVMTPDVWPPVTGPRDFRTCGIEGKSNI